ncbi:ATP-binding protein [Actinoplanes sp. NPDC026670]|uniref:ATP-binding protein n=1 Tax=Actinoplanes sp. NPDC026670 TaxID=3154700 RepID=UPI0033E997E7
MNADHLTEDLRQLAALIAARLDGGPDTEPELDGAWLAELTGGPKPSHDEYVVVLLALVPHLMPHLFSRVIAEHLPEGGDLPEFGGVKAANHRGVLPTGETAQFVLAGDDLTRRRDVQRLFAGRHFFAVRHLLWLDPVPEGEPLMSGRLVLDPEFVERLTTGEVSPPRFSSEFPAERIETAMEWDDLVLPPETTRQIREIENWIAHGGTLLRDWGMGRRLKPGFRALFQGPPGTGKTLTATLLGKQTGRDVYRIDLSRVVSKYIGETEKNLSRLFDKAQNRDWILFFDEADALFGKRTDIRDAHDKYANQEVSYLLQRIETYAGLVILATNQRGNIDEAFLRRFQCAVPFPMPGPEQRRAIWAAAFPPQLTTDVDWDSLAHRFELSGASIVNVIQYCAVQALADGSPRVGRAALEAAVLREYVKEGKIV